jgi:ribulose 1,5-bisphosphate carboxylase large subunit-like protein
MAGAELDLYLTPIPESLPEEEYVIATYLVGAPSESDIIARTTAIALEQTTGTWSRVPGETETVRHRSAGRVVGIYSVPDYESKAAIPADAALRWYVARIAFPWVNFYDNLPLLISTVIGNVSAMDNLKLLDLELPRSYVAQFQGPKFGLVGVRELTHVGDRPLLNNMIKPCTGIDPEAGADLLYGAAAGGTDWIKDDELLAGSPAFSPLTARVKAYMAAASKADKEKGEITLYSVNITDEQPRLLENALRAIEAGANAVMLNVYAVGFSALRTLAEDKRVKVPIMVHNCFSGAMVANPFGGLSSVVGAKLARLAGADIYLDYVPTMKFGGIQEKFLRIVHTCLSPFYGVKATMPHIGGGVTPGLVPFLMAKAGTDVAIGAGGGIHAHPAGPKAGARAMRQAIDAAMKRVPLVEYAEENRELAQALELWGEFGSEKMKSLFALS